MPTGFRRSHLREFQYHSTLPLGILSHHAPGTPPEADSQTLRVQSVTEFGTKGLKRNRFVSLSPEGSHVLFCVLPALHFLTFIIAAFMSSGKTGGFSYLITVTMSLSTGVWSSPTLCPAYFTLGPETSAYFAPSLNLGCIF